jgi:hypothetical protein
MHYIEDEGLGTWWKRMTKGMGGEWDEFGSAVGI